MGQYLTYRQAAEAFGVSPWTIISWVRAGLLRRYKRKMDRRIYVDRHEIERLRSATPTDISAQAEEIEEAYNQV